MIPLMWRVSNDASSAWPVPFGDIVIGLNNQIFESNINISNMCVYIYMFFFFFCIKGEILLDRTCREYNKTNNTRPPDKYYTTHTTKDIHTPQH